MINEKAVLPQMCQGAKLFDRFFHFGGFGRCGKFMEKLILAVTEGTPAVIFDFEKGVFEMSGVSVLEDAKAFYQPVLERFELYMVKPHASIYFTFKLRFFDTPSSKVIFDIFTKLATLYQKGINVKIFWYFTDEQIKQAGERFAELAEIPCDIIKYLPLKSKGHLFDQSPPLIPPKGGEKSKKGATRLNFKFLKS